jgi:amino acid adenylation domain-containing protein
MTSIQLRADRATAPLSYAQEAIWRAECATPGTALHNEAAAFRLRGPLRPDALARGLAAVTARFEILRCAITEDAHGQPVQRFCDATDPVLARVDLSPLPPGEREQRLRQLISQAVATPFDLATAPLLRTHLFELSAEENVLLFTAHHLIADAWALGLFLAALGEAYPATVAAATTFTPARPDFGDYACWQRSDPGIGRDLEYWSGRLSSDLAAVTLPARPTLVGVTPVPEPGVAGRVHRLTIPADLARGLSDLGRANLTSLASVVLTVFCTALARFTGAADMVIGIPVATRNRPGLSGVVGPVLNILPLPVRLPDSVSFAAALHGVRDELKAGLRHRDTPLDLIRQHTGKGTPFSVMYAFHGGPVTNLHLPGVHSILVPAHSGTAKYDLSLFVRPRESGELDLAAEYRTGRVAADTVAAFGDALICLAQDAVRAPGQALSRLPALTGEQRRLIVTGFNPPTAQRSSPGISEQLRARSAAEGGIAVSEVTQSLSLTQIDQCADRVAWRLSGQAGTRVALRMRRGAALIPVIVGIWRAGATLVPVDPAIPPERARSMLEDSETTLLVTDDELGSYGLAGLALRSPAELMPPGAEAEAPRVLPPHPEPDAPAYLMYTSGSTGRPKGVAVPHRCLAALIAGMTSVLGTGPDDVLVAVTSIGFDISMLELFMPLLAGGRVVIATQETVRDPWSLASLLGAARATMMQATPSLWRGLLDSGWHDGQGLRALSGGEPLDPVLAQRLLSCCAGVWNLYGPTETTVWSTAGQVRAGMPVTVGKPIPGTYCYVLGDDDQPVPCGAVGELVIGGAGVSAGYWGQPELTAASFVPDPVRPGLGTVYRTSDRAQHLPDGRIMLHGRSDDQVKLRGHRIELGEVEALLTAHPQVRGAAVIMDHTAPEPSLAAFIVPRTANGTLPSPELAGYLRSQLPEAAVPARFTVLDTLPVNSSGKTDRRALAGLDRPPSAAASTDPPRTGAERTVAALWAEVTGAAPQSVGRSDDFLASGGSSLAAARLLGQVRAALGGAVSLSDFYRDPTVAALTHLASQAAAVPAGTGVTRAAGIGPAPAAGVAVPLTGQQRPLWLHHQLRPDSAAFHLAARVDLAGPVDPAALAEALRQLCARHEVLTARCELRAGQPVLVPQPGAAATLATADLRDVPAAQRPSQLAAWARDEAAMPFRLATGPLLRATLVRTGEATSTLLVAAHHIAIDGWSVSVARS